MTICFRDSAILSVFALLATFPTTAAASETVLYSFPTTPNAYLYGSLLQDRGTLYGTSFQLGGEGDVYSLTDKQGKWRFKSLYDFGEPPDGTNPDAGLVAGSSSEFYSVTAHGGTSNAGTVFSLVRQGKKWVETILHSFTSQSDGEIPSAPLLLDHANGNLYGTNEAGGGFNCGVAFQLTPSGGGWSYSTIYAFKGVAGSDGCSSITPLEEGPNPGTLIGSTYRGGANDKGTLFELVNSNGTWSESVLYSFTGAADGAVPSDLVRAKDGTIYGVAQNGGDSNAGVVFQLTLRKGGWQFKVLHSFDFADGYIPYGITLDETSGALYGTTQQAGAFGYGTVFKLAPNGRTWVETDLHDFENGKDGAYPTVRPIVDSDTGILYGTTVQGGKSGSGVVYSIAP
jgi:uncharacterized repeat protein (TIGR03803 family)